MTDDEFLRAFLQGWPSGERFGHHEHLRVAWLVIERHGPELAAEIAGDGLRRMAAAQGQSVLYNETMTRFWVRLVAHVRDVKGPQESIDQAIEQVPMLMDKSLPFRHWSRELMFGPEARTRWVEPDLLPIAIN
ncbi:MAG: hypothetical protein WCC30_01610 [Candidatus Dormiibacterota bacterium]